ncbi:hypothetical protein ACF1A9_19625 [Streptomyces sp. NPDC014872]|uniref:hypothetical protein n=1 Tax=Streptomyces sp. NPDC014872 TaxID=3364926 RepID=UPI0036FE5483
MAGSGWIGRRTEAGAGGRCGTVLDYRDYTAIVQSHADSWIRPLTAEGPEDHEGDIALALRTAYERLTECREPNEVAAVIEHAARIAEAVATGALPAAEGQIQVLAALSVAETLDACARGA